MTDKILDIANEAYCDGECRLNEKLPLGDRGDGLADFISNELADAEGDVDEAIAMLLRASEELQSVIDALIASTITA